jgi:hypothetical protein
VAVERLYLETGLKRASMFARLELSIPPDANTEIPLVRFQRERSRRSMAGRRSAKCASWYAGVQADCAIEVDGNSYSVPWRLIGVVVSDGRVRIHHADQEVATHAETSGRLQRIVDPTHFHGVA